MAQVEINIKSKPKNVFHKKILRVDLTPMVDLGFLLITFFILTSALSEPTVAKLIMPKDSQVQTLVKNNAVLTLMLTRNDSIRYYEGRLSVKEPVHYCTYANLRSLFQQKQEKVASTLGDRSEATIIIYPGNESTYKNFMDVLDEIQINDIGHYFVMD